MVSSYRGLLFIGACLALSPAAFGQSVEADLVDNASAVLRETMLLPAERIPHNLLSEARGIAVFPSVLKGGFVLGVRHGRGVILVRDDEGKWKPPVFLSITGGSIGWQAGLQATDLILIFRTRKSIDSLLQNKVTLGVDAAVAAGPVGRMAAASTDLMLRAEILSYSRSRGFFAGVSLDGSSLQVDESAGASYYAGTGITPFGKSASATSVVPVSGDRLLTQLASYTGAIPVPGKAAPAVAEAKPSPPISEQERVRQQLVAAFAQLDQLVDEPWRQYLALPVEVASGPIEGDRSALVRVLRRCDTVAADPRYAVLAQRPEFIAARRMLKEYSELVDSGVRGALVLPPPPGDAPQSP